MKRSVLLVLAGLSIPGWILGGTASGCANNIETSVGAGGSGGGSDRDGGITTSSSSGTLTDSGIHDAFSEFTDPGCPDAAPPVTDFSCDPYHQFNGDCSPNEGCYISITYPTMPCGQETFGSYCSPAGPGGQGDSCQGAQECGAGFVCVVSGEGNQCVQLCHLEGSSGCPAGLVCQPIDVQGFGGCL